MFVQTERLKIRRFAPADAPAFAAYRSDPEVARYQGWETPVSEAEALETVTRYGAGDPDAPGWFQYAIDLDGALIGDLGLNLHDNLLQADLGFTLAPAYQGKGYATEAAKALVRYVFITKKLHKISAECDARNTSSARLLERIGFEREGLRRSHTFIKGEWTDDLLFGLLAPPR